MDKLLEGWIELSAKSDELAMRAMEQHEFGHELLVDHDRYLMAQPSLDVCVL